jgi:hypothetical protein
LKGNCGIPNDVLERWPILLIGAGGWTFPKESTTVNCRDDPGSTHVLNELLVNGHIRIVSLKSGSLFMKALSGAGKWSD